ncbi:MAG: hypothetical protein AAB590_02595, partial [Patescibacteria group bacterium]
WTALLGLLIAYLLQNSLFFDTMTSYLAVAIVLGYVIHMTAQTESYYPSLPKDTSWLTITILTPIILLLFYNLSYKPYRQQVFMKHIIEDTTVTERSGAYEKLFPITYHGRTSVMLYLMNKMNAAVPEVLGTLSPTERVDVLKDVHNLRREVEGYIGTRPTHYRLVLSFVQLLGLEYVLQTDTEEREVILTTITEYQKYLLTLSPTNPRNDWEQERLNLLRGSI